ncbi:hypothetical protein IP81_05240, partial [Novosphingobium sp. AAP83]|uniref:hypothetical protein n=1 Tax=Novosphingobium sp. AAP83 TaxID=1523425 RepID=UPI0006CD5899
TQNRKILLELKNFRIRVLHKKYRYDSDTRQEIDDIWSTCFADIIADQSQPVDQPVAPATADQ